MATPLGERLHTGRVVVRIASAKYGVEVDAFNTASQTMERWQAQRAVVALPVFVAARVVENPPDFLREARRQIVYAPWLVANIHLQSPLHDRPGAAPSWDNVLYDDANGRGGLGYVDATHQSLMSTPGATVLTHYRALGDFSGHADLGRKWLLDRPWAAWRDEILAELSRAHPDLASKATRMDVTRYGHAMAIPTPQTNGQIALWPSSNMRWKLSKRERFPARTVLDWERLTFAHSDWAGYSVFEEAFTVGHAACMGSGA
jgi:hypothetical protein